MGFMNHVIFPGQSVPLIRPIFSQKLINNLSELSFLHSGIADEIKRTNHGPRSSFLEGPSIFLNSILRYLNFIIDNKHTKFSTFAGHSLGEFTALVAANFLALEDCFHLILSRHFLIHSSISVNDLNNTRFCAITTPNTFLDLFKIFNDIKCLNLDVACENSRTQIVLTGCNLEFENFFLLTKKYKINYIIKDLNVDFPAYHSSILYEISINLFRLLQNINWNYNDINRVFSNFSSELHCPQTIIRNMTKHVYKTVKWKAIMDLIFKNESPKNICLPGPSKLLESFIPDLKDIHISYC